MMAPSMRTASTQRPFFNEDSLPHLLSRILMNRDSSTSENLWFILSVC